MSSGDFILCLNDDVILHENFIEEALGGFSDGKTGMVSGKILRMDSITIDSTGLFLSLCRSARERGYGRKDSDKYSHANYIFGVNGAVAFYRRAMLDDIKINSEYFDSDYRIFYEDLDIAWRAQNFGWRAYFVPSAIAYHARGATVRDPKGINKRYARRYLRNELHFDLVKNRYLTIIKNETFFGFLFHMPFILIYEVFVWGYIFIFRFKSVNRMALILNALISAFKKRLLLKNRLREIKTESLKEKGG
jgi:GT2 family glycosyltransferase